mgnify:CR=1 FL=1
MSQSLCRREDIDELINKLSPATVLDIGCSKGALPQATHLLDYVDNSNFYPEKIFIVQDFNKKPILPFPDNSIDFIYCSHVLEHLDNPIEIIKEISRVGKFGLVIVPTKFADNLYNSDAIKDGEKYLTARYGHKWWFDYGKDGILEISERKRVLRTLPQSEKEIKTLMNYMPNMFEICISWSGSLSITKEENPIYWLVAMAHGHHPRENQNHKVVRIGASDLGFLLRSQIYFYDAVNDFKHKLKTKLIRKFYVQLLWIRNNLLPVKK